MQTSNGKSHSPVVSVVVPIYNVERYLDQALQSLEKQTLTDIEILCVNDGSTDESPSIIERHTKVDDRVRLIDKPNGGYGSACNRGFTEACGEWIAILEPDDWVEPTMFEDMVGYAGTFSVDVDMVKTPYWRVFDPDTPQERRDHCRYRKRIRPKKQPFTMSDRGAVQMMLGHPSIWSAIYRREFLERCGIRFMEIPGAGWADNPFFMETMCQAKSIIYLDEPYYNYREPAVDKDSGYDWRISLARWQDMADIIERLGVVDETILRAHVYRGFFYLRLLVGNNETAEFTDAVHAMFDRMDTWFVFSDARIPPHLKKVYADYKGIALPKGQQVAYMAHLSKEAFWKMINTGPAGTIGHIRRFYM